MHLIATLPIFRKNYCAYHANQPLTNFCLCQSCLLPVCPTCIKTHTEEHSKKGSHPQFQKIDVVFSSAYQSCSNIIQALSRLKYELIEVQKVKKQNEFLILQKVKLYRNKLIREFERSLMEVESGIIKKMKDEDHRFISQIESIDHQIGKTAKEAEIRLANLSGEDGLRTVIFYLSKNIEIESLKQITSINDKMKSMLERNAYLEVEEYRVEEVKWRVLNYLHLGTIEWGLGKEQLAAAKSMSHQPNPSNPDQKNYSDPFDSSKSISFNSKFSEQFRGKESDKQNLFKKQSAFYEFTG